MSESLFIFAIGVEPAPPPPLGVRVGDFSTTNAGSSSPSASRVDGEATKELSTPSISLKSKEMK
jgi:hypothetical protein